MKLLALLTAIFESMQAEQGASFANNDDSYAWRLMKNDDRIPLEDFFQFSEKDGQGLYEGVFYAFNTVITLLAFADTAAGLKTRADILRVFETAQARCRIFERTLSRTLPHSDISRINSSHGVETEISRETFDLLQKSLLYCKESGGVFDITMGSVVRLWDFHHGVIPEKQALEQAISHVGWEKVELRKEGERQGQTQMPHKVRYFARLKDANACLDAGGTAKGFIADELTSDFRREGLDSFVINLGGNVVAYGRKPDGSPWMVGLQDPRARHEQNSKVVAAVPVENASIVTSGTYERCFEKDGITYHHILDGKTGFPVKTDVAGVSVAARRSMDAEGYSTTLLALGFERGKQFVKSHPSILAAYFVDATGGVRVVENERHTR